MRKMLYFVNLLFLYFNFVSCQLHVYDAVPGLDPSPYYEIQVKEENSSSWIPVFTLLTECTAEKFCNTTGHFEFLKNWSNTYVNFELETGTDIEIKIIKLFGDDLVTKAVVRPETVGEAMIKAGEVIVKISEPCLFTVDINGQMDDQDTGKLPNPSSKETYDGPPIHTVTIFANPFISKPSVDDDGVLAVSAGEDVPSEGNWSTLYFLPGLHDVGHEFRVHSDKSYYIPGDALVYGTFSNDEMKDGQNINIYGHGTISGDKLSHPKAINESESEYFKYRPIGIKGAF